MDPDHEKERLEHKLHALWEWLESNTFHHPKYDSREQNFLRTIKAYERLCDAHGFVS